MADSMLIDGLIKFCDEKSKNIKLKAEPQVFIEIKQALEELKAYKSDDFTRDLLNMGYTKGIKDGYTKGIDEFAKHMKEDTMARTFGLRCYDIDKIAEQMKGGADNE